ncbi:MAG: zinc ribbon domain-containing protein [Thermoanaerobaculaceae bacterium]|nr:zinc ribbon domain-containing protein [Thermoanaerobaculaceae bacterium]
MPLYEYQCRVCGKRFEVLQRLGESSAGLQCPSCASTDVEKRLSTFAAKVGAAPAPCGAPSPSSCGTGGFT